MEDKSPIGCPTSCNTTPLPLSQTLALVPLSCFIFFLWATGGPKCGFKTSLTSLKKSAQLDVRGSIKDAQCCGNVGGQDEQCYWCEWTRLRWRDGYRQRSPTANSDAMSGVIYCVFGMCLHDCGYMVGYKEVSTLLNPLLQRHTCEPLRLRHHLPDSEDRPTWRPWVATLSCSLPAKSDAQERNKAPVHVPNILFSMKKVIQYRSCAISLFWSCNLSL